MNTKLTYSAVKWKQLLRTYLVMLFSITMHILPPSLSAQAGQAAWLSPIPACIATIALLLMFSMLYKKYGVVSLCDIIIDLFGKVLGKIILVGFLLYFLLLASIELRLFGLRLVEVLYSNFSIELIMLLLIGVLIFVVGKGLATFVRMSEILFFVILAIFLITLVLSFNKANFIELLPVTEHDIIPIIQGGRSSLQLMLFIIPMFMLTDCMNEKDHFTKNSVVIVIVLMVLSMLTVITCLLTLGPDLTAKLPFPYLDSVKMIDIANIFEHIESGVAAISIASDLILIGVLTFVILDILSHLIKSQNVLRMSSPILLVTYATAVTVAESIYELNSLKDLFLIPISIYFSFGIAITMIIIGKVRKKI